MENTNQMIDGAQLRRKLRKSAVEARVKASVEKWGGKYLFINWKKQKVHLIAPNGQRLTEFLTFQ